MLLKINQLVLLQIFSDYDVNYLPSFSSDLLHDNYTWTVGFTPSNSKFTEVMQAVETLLNTNIPKTKLEKKCKFGMFILVSLDVINFFNYGYYV